MQPAGGGSGRRCTHDNAYHRPLTLHSNDAGTERYTGFPPAKLRFFYNNIYIYIIVPAAIVVAALALLRKNLDFSGGFFGIHHQRPNIVLCIRREYVPSHFTAKDFDLSL